MSIDNPYPFEQIKQIRAIYDLLTSEEVGLPLLPFGDGIFEVRKEGATMSIDCLLGVNEDTNIDDIAAKFTSQRYTAALLNSRLLTAKAIYNIAAYDPAQIDNFYREDGQLDTNRLLGFTTSVFASPEEKSAYFETFHDTFFGTPRAAGIAIKHAQNNSLAVFPLTLRVYLKEFEASLLAEAEQTAERIGQPLRARVSGPAVLKNTQGALIHIDMPPAIHKLSRLPPHELLWDNTQETNVEYTLRNGEVLGFKKSPFNDLLVHSALLFNNQMVHGMAAPTAHQSHGLIVVGLPSTMTLNKLPQKVVGIDYAEQFRFFMSREVISLTDILNRTRGNMPDGEALIRAEVVRNLRQAVGWYIALITSLLNNEKIGRNFGESTTIRGQLANLKRASDEISKLQSET